MNIKTDIDFFLDKTVEKKICNTFYNKSYVRSTITTDNLSIFDNYSELNAIRTLKRDKIKVGTSKNTKITFYQSTFGYFIKFRLESFKQNLKLCNYVDFFNKSFNLLCDEENLYRNTLILKPKKGGYKCYSLGFFGFVPRKHFFYVRNKLFRENTINNDINYSYFYYFIKLFRNNVKSNINKYFFFRLDLHVGSFTFFPKKIFYNYVKTKKKKIFRNRFNLVFLSQEYLLLLLERDAKNRESTSESTDSKKEELA